MRKVQWPKLFMSSELYAYFPKIKKYLYFDDQNIMFLYFCLHYLPQTRKQVCWSFKPCRICNINVLRILMQFRVFCQSCVPSTSDFILIEVLRAVFMSDGAAEKKCNIFYVIRKAFIFHHDCFWPKIYKYDRLPLLYWDINEIY